MKTKKNPFFPIYATAFAVVAFAMSTAAHAQSWDGGSATANSWGTPANWIGDVAPTFGTTADLTFNNLTRPDNDIGANRTVRSISFGADMDGAFTINNRNFTPGGAAQQLTFQAASGNATLSIDAGATGNISIGWNGAVGSTVGGGIGLGSNLDIIHNGSGNLTFSRGLTGANGFTKSGTGTMVVSNFPTNNFTGAANFNGGRAIFGNSVSPASATGDLGTASAINFGGGTLEIQTNGVTKTISPNISVSAASTLAYNNNGTTNRQLLLNTGSMALNGVLTVQNISTTTTLANVINISRNLTGAQNLIVETYNNINSGTAAANFGLGRVAFGGANGSWSGNLIIRQGTAEVFGDSTLGQVNVGTGDIILGETANASGAGFLTASSNSGAKTIANDITVRSGGFRTIRGGSDHTYTFSGNIALEGDLNVHNGLFFNDKYMIFTGLISGAGDLTVTKGTAGGFTRLTGDNSGWSGDLKISQGALNLLGTANTPGTGDIFLGATDDATAASLTFSHAGSLTYTNDIVVNTGGTRTLQGNNAIGINVTFSGGVTLDGDLTVDHTWSSSDCRFNLNGPISGGGGLRVIRSGGNLETTLRMAGTNTYSGGTTVANSASLALASTASLASNVLVQAGGRIGGPGTISANLTLEDTANFFFYAVGSTPGSYVPMTVNGTVTLNNNFSVANIVGGSRGEPVDWNNTPDGTYTLIGSTPSSLSNIQNFGAANYATIPVSATSAVPRYAYFQGTTGLQIVVSSTPPIAADPFTTWSGGAAFNDDTNNDGIENGLAFLLGAADVNENANSLLPVSTQSGGALTLTFKMRDLAARGAALLQVQHSSDLGISDPWSTLVTVPNATGNVGGIDFTVSPGVAPFNNVTATIPAAGNAANGRLFARVKSNP